MREASSKGEKAIAKLRKLSKDELIWCILEMEKHNLGRPSIDMILCDLAYKQELDNIDRCAKLAEQAHEKRMAYNALVEPYVGKPLTAVPKQVFDRAVKLLQEAEAADKEWFRLSGIKEETK